MKKFTSWIAVLMLSIISMAFLLMLMGFRVNTTDSIPVGLYRITNLKNIKNAFVIFCPEDRPAFKEGLERGYIDSGLCPDGYGYLMKKVVATNGDKISVTSEGVFVNHQPIPFSKPIPSDGMDRPLPQWHTRNYQLKEDEILTMTSQSAWSFDSRYYGPVHTGQIKGMITPVWVKATMEK
ncbi:conjugative transfer signal peptidase TraF [Legionella nagasakiensis]|uniref:conjugative transfer signal peptidase TraF n=1 Tax=Legionella nagasakiensis TaxID=535290 RepID=UPI00105554B4|nr:conjugative transfer signal peptidase TraF [Legionella nagasakiensis]